MNAGGLGLGHFAQNPPRIFAGQLQEIPSRGELLRLLLVVYSEGLQGVGFIGL